MGNKPAKIDVGEETKRESGARLATTWWSRRREASAATIGWALCINASKVRSNRTPCHTLLQPANRQQAQPLALLLCIGTIDVVEVDTSYVRYKTTYTWVKICMPMNYTRVFSGITIWHVAGGVQMRAIVWCESWCIILVVALIEKKNSSTFTAPT